MGNFLPMQSEEIILSSDMERFELLFREVPRVVMIQCYDKDGNAKVIKFKDNAISPSGKTAMLKKGDIISYIAVFS